MRADLKIGIGNSQDGAHAFVEAWNRAARGEAVATTEERLTFENLETLLHALTAARWWGSASQGR